MCDDPHHPADGATQHTSRDASMERTLLAAPPTGPFERANRRPPPTRVRRLLELQDDQTRIALTRLLSDPYGCKRESQESHSGQCGKTYVHWRATPTAWSKR